MTPAAAAADAGAASLRPIARLKSISRFITLTQRLITALTTTTHWPSIASV